LSTARAKSLTHICVRYWHPQSQRSVWKGGRFIRKAPLNQMDKAPLISTLCEDLQAAYDRLTLDFVSIGRTPSGAPCFPVSDDQVQRLIQVAASRCGAGISAAVKREKRRWLLGALIASRADGLDVTPAVAKGAARRVLGRRVDERFVAQLLATPGRTAANKSQVRASDLVPTETRLDDELGPLLDRIDAEKSRAHSRWYASQGRLDALADWRHQRLNLSLGEYRFEKVGLSPDKLKRLKLV